MSGIASKNFVIATHVYATGPAQDLLEYLLKNKASRLLYIGHPLFYDARLKGSGYEYYEAGIKRAEHYARLSRIPAPVSYVKDALYNVFRVLVSGGKWDLYVGSNNLNALGGVVLRWLGRVDKAVYYVIDYNPNRFANQVMNAIYHRLDQFCVRHCDETWNLSPRMQSARKEYFGFEGGNQKEAPMGIWFDRIKRPASFRKNTLAFMGHLIEKQGLQHVIDAVPAILAKLPDFKLVVVGGGEYLPALKARAEKLGVAAAVDFRGYVEKHEEVERILAECAAAVALYEAKDERGNPSFTYFTDPGKVKAYLACGLPVILSDVAHNARAIEEKRCGAVVSNAPESIANAVVGLLADPVRLGEYRSNAVAYALQYDWKNIFARMLSGLENK
jgi:glycosyltransferase involved in cell wall biosynthesis